MNMIRLFSADVSGFGMKIVRLLPVVAVFTLCACGAKENLETIVISEFENQPRDFTSMASGIDMVPIYVDSAGAVVSQPYRICANDTLLYVLDDVGTLSMFNLVTGKQVKSIRSVGHAGGEYIRPVSLDLFEDRIYLLDQQSKKVIEYDLSLNYVSHVTVNFVPQDFCRIEKGFLFSRLDKKNGDDGFLYTDKEGNVQKTFVPTNMLGEHVVSMRSFTGNGKHPRIMHENEASDVWMWVDGQEKLMATLSFREPDSHSGNRDHVQIKDCYMTDHYIICSFLYDKRQNYAFCSKETGEVIAGFHDINKGLPFFPMSQDGNCILALYVEEDLQELPNWDSRKAKGADFVFFRYHL